MKNRLHLNIDTIQSRYTLAGATRTLNTVHSP